MENWKSGVLKAQWAYDRRDKFAYLYGCKGERIVSRRQFDRYVKAEPGYFRKYSAKELDDIYKYCHGKYCFDCSGFVAWLCYPTLKKYSTALYNDKTLEFKDYTKSVSGALLYTTHNGLGRHIGIDGGNGYYFHMANEMETIRKEKFSDNPYYWEHFFEVSGVDYTNCTEQTIENIIKNSL